MRTAECSVFLSLRTIVWLACGNRRIRKHSRLRSGIGEVRLEIRRYFHYPAHHEQGDNGYEAIFTSISTFHRHPHLLAHALCCMLHSKEHSQYAQKSWGGHPRCDLAPLTTSFGTVGQWERQHLAMAATCPEGEAWAASRNWNHETLFLWDPRAAPTFHPLTTLRHRARCRTCHLPTFHSCAECRQ